MDEQKKPAGRPQIYQGWQPEQTGRRRPRSAQRPQEERRKGEYRPLAVTEQKVSEHQSVKAAKGQKQKVIHVADIDRKPESKPVQQRPSQMTECQPIQQRSPQITENKGAPMAESKGAPMAESKGAPMAENKGAPMAESKRVPMAESKRVRMTESRRVKRTESRVVQQRPQQTIQRQPTQQAVQKKNISHQVQELNQKKMTAVKRRRELENEVKMRFLWWFFGILCVILTAAIIYEVILGHGIKETGAERMEEQKQELVMDTEQNNIEILTPGGELVSDIKEREARRNMQRQSETEIQSGQLANDSAK